MLPMINPQIARIVAHERAAMGVGQLGIDQRFGRWAGLMAVAVLVVPGRRWHGAILASTSEGGGSPAGGENIRLREALERLPDPNEELARASPITRFLARLLRVTPEDPRDNPVIRKAILQPTVDEIRTGNFIESALRGRGQQRRISHPQRKGGGT